ncbi:MAG: stage V sporulation protein SpoVM [Provencibacterium sp.]|nr:stage V sporulation protein SpoVM [Provencibacterium sp.]
MTLAESKAFFQRGLLQNAYFATDPFCTKQGLPAYPVIRGFIREAGTYETQTAKRSMGQDGCHVRHYGISHLLLSSSPGFAGRRSAAGYCRLLLMEMLNFPHKTRPIGRRGRMMKIVVVKSPRFISGILKVIFKMKKDA